MKEIADDLVKYKKTKEWKDDDNLTRFTKLRIITKNQLFNIIQDYDDNVAMIKLAKKYKIAFVRIRKIVKLYCGLVFDYGFN